MMAGAGAVEGRSAHNFVYRNGVIDTQVTHTGQQIPTTFVANCFRYISFAGIHLLVASLKQCTWPRQLQRVLS